jgi:hypothetical protein
MQGTVTIASMSPAAWNEDLTQLVQGLEQLHGPSLYHAVSRADFAAAVGRARSLAAGASNEQMLVQVYRLLALVAEGHTSVNASPDRSYFVSLRWFPEGVFLLGCDGRVSDWLLGGRVRSIGGLSVSDGSRDGDFERLVDPLISVDLPGGKAGGSSVIVTNAYLMAGLGLSSADGGLPVELEDGTLAAVPPSKPGEPVQARSVTDGIPAQSLAASLRPHTETNWYEILPGGVLYLRYNDCTGEAATLFDEVLAKLRRGEAEKLVVDLRWNGGGDSQPGSRFAEAVAQISAINKVGSLYVLVGPRTFSSAMMNAVDFRAGTAAIIVGEPLTEPFEHYGEVRRFRLGHSGLVIATSTKLWKYDRGLVSKGEDPRRVALAPHPGFERRWTFAAYAAGVDPALDLVLAQP